MTKAAPPGFNLSQLPSFDKHESVLFMHDAATGLRGFVAIHNTALGPATGGTRYWSYSSESAALDDALRLSRAMTYKCALADVPYGGGKAVIIRDRKYQKTAAFLRAYAGKINILGGCFTTGEDVGITDDDIHAMAKVSRYINGARGAGDLGPWAALGVYYAMKEAMRSRFGSESLADRTVAIKGMGKLGLHLAGLIAAEGGRIIGADVDAAAVALARKKIKGITIVSPNSIHAARADVYSPCAMGGELTAERVARLRCAVVCGGANNQLATRDVGRRLAKEGILYVPDYLANAGGLINVAGEMRSGGYNKRWVEKKIKDIGKTTREILLLAKKRKRPANEVADEVAWSRVSGKG